MAFYPQKGDKRGGGSQKWISERGVGVPAVGYKKKYIYININIPKADKPRRGEVWQSG